VNFSERQLEAAGAVVDQERDAHIARIRAGLSEPGEEDCIDCGRPIPEARRRVLPSAERCVPCQTKFERCHS
jgi:phage/conjugal plasmid C-4 type zinc finger TraR family protein